MYTEVMEERDMRPRMKLVLEGHICKGETFRRYSSFLCSLCTPQDHSIDFVLEADDEAHMEKKISTFKSDMEVEE